MLPFFLFQCDSLYSFKCQLEIINIYVTIDIFGFALLPYILYFLGFCIFYTCFSFCVYFPRLIQVCMFSYIHIILVGKLKPLYLSCNNFPWNILCIFNQFYHTDLTSPYMNSNYILLTLSKCYPTYLFLIFIFDYIYTSI